MTPVVTGHTRVVGIIGDPVAHSRSPAIHNAAFAACGLDWVYVAFPVVADDGAAAVHAARTLGLAGLNVTMPHKTSATGACDTLSAEAEALGAVNTLTIERSHVVGHSTDGAGFLRALDDESIATAGRAFVVLGSGGAARAVVHALGTRDAHVTVVARREAASREAATLAPGAEIAGFEDLAAVIARSDVVVNATPVGMDGEALPIDVGLLGSGQDVVDLVYEPVETPLVAAAHARGLRAVNGLGMLVHQAALAFTLWTGVEAPLDVMRRAAAGP